MRYIHALYRACHRRCAVRSIQVFTKPAEHVPIFFTSECVYMCTRANLVHTHITRTHTHVHSGGAGAWRTWSSTSTHTVSTTSLVSSACGRSPRYDCLPLYVCVCVCVVLALLVHMCTRTCALVCEHACSWPCVQGLDATLLMQRIVLRI